METTADTTTGQPHGDGCYRVTYPAGYSLDVYRCDAGTGPRWVTIPDDDDREDPAIALAEYVPTDDLDAPAGWEPR